MELRHLRACRARDDDVREDKYTTADDRTTVTFVSDGHVGLTYIGLSGEDVEEVADEVRDRIDIVAGPDALEGWRAADTRDDKVGSLYLMGVAAPPEGDPAIEEAIAGGLSDDDPQVRRAAILASGYAGYDRFRDDLIELAARDPDARVKAEAARMLESWDSGD